MVAAVRVLADLAFGVQDGVMNDRGSIPAELYFQWTQTCL